MEYYRECRMIKELKESLDKKFFSNQEIIPNSRENMAKVVGSHIETCPNDRNHRKHTKNN